MRKFVSAIVMCALAPAIAFAQQETPQVEQTAAAVSASTCQQCSTAAEEPTCCAASQKVVMYSFTADWCGPCKTMKETVFADKAVAKCLAENCQVIEVNIDKDQATTNKFGITAIPTQVFVSADGKVIKKIVGSTDKEALIAAAEESAAHTQEDAKQTKQAMIKLTSPKISIKKNACETATFTAKATGDNVVTFTVNGKPVTLKAHSIRIQDNGGEVHFECKGIKGDVCVTTDRIVEEKACATACEAHQQCPGNVQATKATPSDIVFWAPNAEKPQVANVLQKIQRVVKPGVVEHIIVKRIQKSADGEEVEVEVAATEACPASKCAGCATSSKFTAHGQCPASECANKTCPASACSKSECLDQQCPHSATATITATSPAECPAGACLADVLATHCSDCGQCPFASQAESCPAAGVWNALPGLHAPHTGLVVGSPRVIRPSEEIPTTGAYCVVTTTGQRHSYAGEFVRMTDDFIIVKENGTTHWIPRNNVECLSVTEEKIATRPKHPVSATRATVFPHPIALPYPGALIPTLPAKHPIVPKMAHPALPAKAPRTKPAKNAYHIDLTLKRGDEVISRPRLMTLEHQRASIQVGQSDGANFYAGVEVREIADANDTVFVEFYDQADKRTACTQMICQKGETNTIPWSINNEFYELVVKVNEHSGNKSCCQQGQAKAKEVTSESKEGIRTNFEVRLPQYKK